MKELQYLAVALLPLALACGEVSDTVLDASSSQEGDDGGAGDPADGGGGGGQPDATPVACEGPADCDDEIACTVDTCTEDDVCDRTPQDEMCDDGMFCNGAEICSATEGCVNADPPDCGETDACIARGCSDEESACTESPRSYTIAWEIKTTETTETGLADLGCDATETVHTETFPLGGGSCTIDFFCSIDESGLLEAAYVQTGFCTGKKIGPAVATGCSVISDSQSSGSFECCFP